MVPACVHFYSRETILQGLHQTCFMVSHKRWWFHFKHVCVYELKKRFICFGFLIWHCNVCQGEHIILELYMAAMNRYESYSLFIFFGICFLVKILKFAFQYVPHTQFNSSIKDGFLQTKWAFWPIPKLWINFF